MCIVIGDVLYIYLLAIVLSLYIPGYTELSLIQLHLHKRILKVKSLGVYKVLTEASRKRCRRPAGKMSGGELID